MDDKIIDKYHTIIITNIELFDYLKSIDVPCFSIRKPYYRDKGYMNVTVKVEPTKTKLPFILDYTIVVDEDTIRLIVSHLTVDSRQLRAYLCKNNLDIKTVFSDVERSSYRSSAFVLYNNKLYTGRNHLAILLEHNINHSDITSEGCAFGDYHNVGMSIGILENGYKIASYLNTKPLLELYQLQAPLTIDIIRHNHSENYKILDCVSANTLDKFLYNRRGEELDKWRNH